MKIYRGEKWDIETCCSGATKAFKKMCLKHIGDFCKTCPLLHKLEFPLRGYFNNDKKVSFNINAGTFLFLGSEEVL